MVLYPPGQAQILWHRQLPMRAIANNEQTALVSISVDTCLSVAAFDLFPDAHADDTLKGLEL